MMDALQWLKPAYWRQTYVTAQHVTNNVPRGSRIVELGKDAKARAARSMQRARIRATARARPRLTPTAFNIAQSLYYLTEPADVTLISPTPLQEPPIREAAAKARAPDSRPPRPHDPRDARSVSRAQLKIPLFILTGALGTLPLRAGGYDAALCVDMLRETDTTEAADTVSILARALRPGGRLLYVECRDVGMRDLASAARLDVISDDDGDFEIGIATKPLDAPREVGAQKMGAPGGSRADRRAAARRKKKSGRKK